MARRRRTDTATAGAVLTARSYAGSTPPRIDIDGHGSHGDRCDHRDLGDYGGSYDHHGTTVTEISVITEESRRHGGHGCRPAGLRRPAGLPATRPLARRSAAAAGLLDCQAAPAAGRPARV